jgi:hypothetical protein
MKIIIEPQAMTWTDAKSFAAYKGGRLPTPAELQQLSKSRAITVDVWACEENEDEPSAAKHWSRKYQAIKSKDKSGMCLLVFLSV